jgi:hypothetical protein
MHSSHEGSIADLGARLRLQTNLCFAACQLEKEKPVKVRSVDGNPALRRSVAA